MESALVSEAERCYANIEARGSMCYVSLTEFSLAAASLVKRSPDIPAGSVQVTRSLFCHHVCLTTEDAR